MNFHPPRTGERIDNHAESRELCAIDAEDVDARPTGLLCLEQKGRIIYRFDINDTGVTNMYTDEFLGQRNPP